MSFAFPETASEPFNYAQILKATDLFPPEYVREASVARQKMCDTLHAQPTSLALLESVEAYLPYLQYILAHYEEQPREQQVFPRGCKFQWRSSLSKGIRISLTATVIEKPMVGVASLWYEAIYTLLAYAYCLANLAGKKVGGGVSLQSASEASLSDAADLLCRAAGVFKFVGSAWAPRWGDRKDAPPECSAQLLSLLAELMLADAHRLALAKAERRGMSPATLVKLGIVVVEGYEQCSQLLSSLNRHDAEELADPFASYVADGHRAMEALLCRRLACLKHEEDQNGLAVALITRTNNLLVKAIGAHWAPWKKLAVDMLPEVEELRAKMVRINNNVTYQRIPEEGEMKAAVFTGGRPILDIKGFVPPTAIEPALSGAHDDKDAGSESAN